MTAQPFDTEVLRTCANAVARALNRSNLSATRFQTVLAEVLERHEAIRSVELGLITEEEAANLLLAHIHSALFEPGEPFENFVADRELRCLARSGLFGKSGRD
jgi:hypothetical protein